MDRCYSCPACDLGDAFRNNKKGKKKLKRVKRYEVAHKCTNPTDTTGKRKLSELEHLHVAGYGGQIRGEAGHVPTANLVHSERAARPHGSLKKPTVLIQIHLSNTVMLSRSALMSQPHQQILT